MRASNDPLLTIADVARRAGVAASALRYYESLGLIASSRLGSGHRRYPRSVLRRVAFIVFAQRVGFTLGEIAAQLAGLPRERAPTGSDWNRLSRTWKARVEQRIAELRRLDMRLGECIGCGCLSMKRCRLVNPGDCAAESGAGPKAWRAGPDRG